ncbi:MULTISPECIES: hypothetical protein [Bacillus subtilis group]|uniref:hypothetical protein n=1 Tax=Bacillus subtilis group TaxID=653685 RepID=UPI00084B3611|nr:MULTISPECIES: hypothetical protein [Bacillus subtilis group]NRF03117.1 hypothetical protein [Bacillus subtilis]NRG38879.1 hypothetical protein [Bacillus subtilis]OEC78608.1 hypothetical protein BCV60_03735 [Bacillus halotolerans]QGI33035.1 hypothetical protein GII85_11760 [Bacillus subtilis]WHX55504.1 hypothetical protein QNH30_11870 [Bacillus subtilis]
MKEFKNDDMTIVGEQLEDNGQYLFVRSEGFLYAVSKKNLTVTDLPKAEKSEEAVKPVKKRVVKSKKAENAVE